MENVIDKKITDKLRGGYYTPKAITKFICKWAISHATQKVLEPSCGDGNFIEAAIERFIELGVSQDHLFGLVQGVELIKEEAEKSKARAANYGLNSTTIVNTDFFSFISNSKNKAIYDVVVGNPPFIRYQNFPEEHRAIAIKLMQDLGLSPNKLTNIWVPFLVLSANLLAENGKLGMVIPAELFQVKYAGQTRVFLSNFFSRITIVTFKKLVFEDIQQEVVLLLCEKKVSSNEGIRVIELNSLQELETLNVSDVHKTPVKSLEHNSEKWTKYFLEESEIQLLRKIKADKRIDTCAKVMDVDVGIVTGRNDFFMLSQEVVAKWKLQPYTRKVVSRSSHLKGLIFEEKDFQNNSDAQHHGYLFIPPDEDFDKLPQVCKEYIRHGEELEYNVGYKCRIRKRWYITPSLWTPDAFALRQVADYPKIIINKAGASSTDTIHRVRLKKEVVPEIVAVSFLNSLSFAFSEILGRSYGGGVLTFEPTEIEEIPLPTFDKDEVDIKKVDSLIREKQIDEVLDIIDQELLIKQMGFTLEEVGILRGIWRKLSNRRLNRK